MKYHMCLTMLILILAITWIEHAHAFGFIRTFVEDMYTGTGLCGDVEQQSTSRGSTTGHSISSDCGPETFPAEVEAHTRVDCPDDATYQSSFDHLNFNTIARDYFCSWMHLTPFNIPDEYRYSGDLKTDSMGACAVSNTDTCLTGIKTARSRCAMPDEAGSVLIVPKPRGSSNSILQGRATDLQAPSFGNPKASYSKMDELFKFKSSESAFLLDSGGNLKSIDMSEYTAMTPACESCQGGADCLVSHYAWFQPRGDTTKKKSMYLVNGNEIESAICEPQGIHGLNGWGASQKTQCGSTSSSWYEVPSEITYKDLTGVPRLVTQNPRQYLPGVTKGCAKNLNGVSGSVCDWVNAGCIVRRHKDTDPLKGSWYSEDRNIEYNDDGSLIQAVEFMRAVDDEFTILTSGGRFRVRLYTSTRCRAWTLKQTIEFGDEAEFKQKHAFRFTGSINSLQFELVAEDGNTASCLGSGQTCESGYGVEVVDGQVTNTSVNWRSGIVQCHRCKEMEISSKVRHQSCDVYLSECVQCGKNTIPNAGKTACLPCDMNTPYRPLNETACRQCPRDMYWDYVYAKDCVKIPIMTILCDDAPIVVGGVQSNRGQLYVDPTKDMYRPNPSTNQVERKDLIEDHYLKIRADEHKLRRCTCGSFEYAYGCGGKFADVSSFDMYVIDDANPSSVQRLSTINSGLSGACDSINLNQYHLKREGECRRCQTCSDGYFNEGCGTDSGRGVCKACTSSCPNSNEYLTFEGDGCSDPQAVTDNVCKSCEDIKQVGGNLESKYYIVVGCGGSGVTSFRRWVMDGINVKLDTDKTLEQGRDVLEDQTCNYDSSSTACQIDGTTPVVSLYEENHKDLPYCPRGWYISEPTGTGWKTTWNRDVCYKCGSTEQDGYKKASNYIPCDGASTIDTEIWIPACEVNFYDEKLDDGSFACRPCETCSSGFV